MPSNNGYLWRNNNYEEGAARDAEGHHKILLMKQMQHLQAFTKIMNVGTEIAI